ncbi:hypothetical protein KC342_g8458 [Hortaea werneckii]|nr:hypothetical protein KC342_g8458 [Hortaea werneckii]KAI6847846.1 hypothetical protein KC350_g3262 [Hortaea werneckii]
MQAKIEKDKLQRIFHHVFLPPQLPQEADDTSDSPLLLATITAMRAIEDILPDSLAIKYAVVALENLQAVNSLSGCATSEHVLSQRLLTLGEGHTIPVHIRSQNAAIVVTRQRGNLVFEELELSPRNEAVMGTRGRLVRDFPGLAVEIDLGTTDMANFIPAVANMLSTMCQQPVPGMQPQSKKARGHHEEIRDTAHPAATSELLFGFLRGFGNLVSVSAISKNTREEVLWKDAEVPWRRCPMWLLIRVVLQLTLERSPDGSRLLYKETMVFFMGQILQSSLEGNLAPEILHTMNAKIVRRICKLYSMTEHNKEKAVNQLLIKPAEMILEKAAKILSDQWEDTQQQHSRKLDLGSLVNLSCETDTHVSLPLLDRHIENIHSRKQGRGPVEFSPSSDLVVFNSNILPQVSGFESKDCTYTTANLQQLEHWIGCNIDSWTLSNTREGSYAKLHELMTEYHSLAGRHYCDNPEAISMMILTIMELWVACDKIATEIDPRLTDYGPGVPLDIFQSLLIPLHQQMERLKLIEEHLQRRRDLSRYKQAQKLFDMTSPQGYANRYFDGPAAHQDLLRAIVRQAEDARQAKLTELRAAKDEYRRLNALYTSASCAYVTVVVDDWMDPPETVQRHRNDCAKCSYREQRDDLKISVHEWPLPENHLEAQVVVFELDVPDWFAFWRDFRFHLLQDVLRGDREELSTPHCYRLSQSDPHLSNSHYRGSKTHRIDLLSECKPFIVSHYRSKRVNSALQTSEVCVANGLRYQYYDAGSRRYVGILHHPDTIARMCTYELPNKHLQRYVFRPSCSRDGPPPNHVIANQDICPTDMCLEEYKELASIPLGHHIQWANMILQLAMPSVDFKKEVTTLVFLQCIYQTGPPNDTVLREAHEFFSDDAKVKSLIDQTEAAIGRVKQNWESAQALGLFATILRRALSLNTSSVGRCLTLLAQIRMIALGWLGHLRDRAYAAFSHEDRMAFVQKSVEIAMVCVGTFDVDDMHLETMLGSTAGTSSLVQCSIIVQQGRNTNAQQGQRSLLPHLRHQRTLHRSHEMLVRYQSGLVDAVAKSWSAYAPGRTGWMPVSDITRNWLTTTTATGLKVHYNSLDGEILVNGLPLDQPPKSYREQRLYSTLFGQAVVEVMPGSSPGFDFSTKRCFQSCVVQLGMHDSDSYAGDRLVVRTANASDSDSGHGVSETIPRHLMANMFPESFLDDYVHWYNHGSGKIEFRPLEKSWISDVATNWILAKDKNSRDWRLSKGPDAVIGMKKATLTVVADILRPLMRHSGIHCISQSSIGQLLVTIPALRLNFHLRNGSSLLRSKEFRGMAVDYLQTIGTLVGFRNKILLKSATGKQLLLVKESTVSYVKDRGHIAVSVDDISTARVHALRVDPQLGRLIDNGDLQ